VEYTKQQSKTAILLHSELQCHNTTGLGKRKDIQPVKKLLALFQNVLFREIGPSRTYYKN